MTGLSWFVFANACIIPEHVSTAPVKLHVGVTGCLAAAWPVSCWRQQSTRAVWEIASWRNSLIDTTLSLQVYDVIMVRGLLTWGWLAKQISWIFNFFSSGKYCYLRDKHQKKDKRAKCSTLIVPSNIYLNIPYLQFTLFNSLQDFVWLLEISSIIFLLYCPLLFK